MASQVVRHLQTGTRRPSRPKGVAVRWSWFDAWSQLFGHDAVADRALLLAHREVPLDVPSLDGLCAPLLLQLTASAGNGVRTTGLVVATEPFEAPFLFQRCADRLAADAHALAQRKDPAAPPRAISVQGAFLNNSFLSRAPAAFSVGMRGTAQFGVCVIAPRCGLHVHIHWNPSSHPALLRDALAFVVELGGDRFREIGGAVDCWSWSVRRRLAPDADLQKMDGDFILVE